MAEIRTKGIINLPATGQLPGSEGKLVTLGASGLTLVAAANAVPFGVVLEPPAEGVERPAADVAILGAFAGTVHFKAGTAITRGARLMQRADGTVGAAATGVCVGVAVEDAAVDELFEGAPLAPFTVS